MSAWLGVLPAALAAELRERGWAEPCEAVFAYLATFHPAALARLIEDGALEPPDLTYAAERLGSVDDSAAVRRALRPLLRHRCATVREGAIYGLERHLDGDLVTKLFRMAMEDSNTAVREVATLVVREFFERAVEGTGDQ